MKIEKIGSGLGGWLLNETLMSCICTCLASTYMYFVHQYKGLSSKVQKNICALSLTRRKCWIISFRPENFFIVFTF